MEQLDTESCSSSDPDENEFEKKEEDMKDPKWQAGFGITFERLRLHHKYLVQQERLFLGCNYRNPLADEKYPPRVKFQYLVKYHNPSFQGIP